RRGNSPVKESGHVLILGWSSKAVEVISLLAQRHRRPRVVILGPRDVSDMQESLRSSGAYGLGAKIVLRSGSPANHHELERVACADARSVMVVSTPLDGGDADIEAVKTLLALASFPWKGQRPKVACEIASARGIDVARAASHGAVPIVSSGEVVSRILFQASRQSGIAAIYDEIFSFTGAGIHIRKVPRCAGLRFGDIEYAFPRAVLMGISTAAKRADGSERYDFLLAPERSRAIAADEWLIFLAHTDAITDDLDRPVFRSTVAMPKAYLLLPTDGSSGGNGEPASTVFTSEISRAEKYLPPPRERILVLGWNDNIHDLLAEHDACVGSQTEITVVSAFDEGAARAQLAQRGAPKRLKTAFVQGDARSRTGIKSLAPQEYDCIVVLADASHRSPDPDAATVMSLVMVRDALRGRQTRPRLVAEILDPLNAGVVSGLEIDDLVISPRVVSQQLVQISQQAMLADIYRELLSSGGVEIYLKPASRYVVPGRSCSFNDLVYSAQRLREVALGVRIARDRAKPGGGLQLNPPKDSRWDFADGDMVVVLAEELYDRRA
nr:hypothetical protein [Planctomycetota bacterium]